MSRRSPPYLSQNFSPTFYQRTKNLYEEQIAFHRTCLDTLNIKDGDLAEKGNFGRAPNPLGLSATLLAEHYEFDKTLSKTQ